MKGKEREKKNGREEKCGAQKIQFGTLSILSSFLSARPSHVVSISADIDAD